MLGPMRGMNERARHSRMSSGNFAQAACRCLSGGAHAGHFHHADCTLGLLPVLLLGATLAPLLPPSCGNASGAWLASLFG